MARSTAGTPTSVSPLPQFVVRSQAIHLFHGRAGTHIPLFNWNLTVAPSKDSKTKYIFFKAWSQAMLWFKKEFVYSWYKWPGSGSSSTTRTQACCFTTHFLTCNILTWDLENYPPDYPIRLLKWLNDIVNYCDSKMTAACKQHFRYLWETAPKQQGEMSVYTWFWWKGNTCKWVHRGLTPAPHSCSAHQGVLMVGGSNSTWFSPYRSRWQVPMASR